MIKGALQSILQYGGLAANMADRVRFVGSDPVFPTRYRVGTAGAAALGALGLAVAAIRQRQSGQSPEVEVEVRRAAASLRSSRYVRIDGELPKEPPGRITGFYKVADGRWCYFHCNLPPHQAALLRVLGVPADRARIAEAALRWQALEIEQAVDAAGGCAPYVRTPEEWRALPNTPALAAEPLVDIRKIADSPPIALPSGPRMLTGIRVLDLTRVLAGPTCGRLLAEYGADVLKITCEKHPDSPALELDTGYLKRTATLDIASAAGGAQFKALLGQCDVFSQAYRLSAMASLGFSPENVAALRPGIIYASLNAYGFTGQWRGRRGFDTVVQSASGMAHISGRGKAPQFMPVSSLDYLTGYLMTFGVLVALRRRADEGGSYSVKVSLGRICEWVTAMGLLEQDAADAASDELSADELASWLVELPTPGGRLTRLRPVIRFSDPALKELPPWNAPDQAGPAWAAG